jgi:predicted DNA-binding mobile mystery protein A
MSQQQHMLITRQIDRKLGKLRSLSSTPAPRRGWINEIRRALGMSLRQLGRRMDVSQAAVSQFERGEVEGTITLATIRKVGEALGCEFTCALIPKGSLEDLIRARARKVAEETLERAAHSMDLERQGVPPAETRKQLDELTEQLFRDRPRTLWDDVDD